MEDEESGLYEMTSGEIGGRLQAKIFDGDNIYGTYLSSLL
jgi:hypothetical protein